MPNEEGAVAIEEAQQDLEQAQQAFSQARDAVLEQLADGQAHPSIDVVEEVESAQALDRAVVQHAIWALVHQGDVQLNEKFQLRLLSK